MHTRWLDMSCRLEIIVERLQLYLGCSSGETEYELGCGGLCLLLSFRLSVRAVGSIDGTAHAVNEAI